MGKRQDLLNGAKNGNVAVVRKIVENCCKKSGPFSSFRRNPSINGQDINGYTPLHYACLNGYKEIVCLLLACVEIVVDVPDIRGSTPLYLASWAGHHEITKMLLTHRFKPANPNAQTKDNETPLHCAAQHGYTAVLSNLLTYGADPHIRNNSFQTPLDLASQYGHLKAVEILIQSHPELLDYFRLYDNTLSRGTDDSPPYAITPIQHIFTHTCLHLAARNGHRDVIETLINAGVDPNILTHAGTALHEAALSGRTKVVCFLLRSGTDPYALDGQGRTVMDILKDYPPHINYDIVTIIKEFCQDSSEMDNKTHFMPVKEIDAGNVDTYTNDNETINSCTLKPNNISKDYYTPMKALTKLSLYCDYMTNKDQIMENKPIYNESISPKEGSTEGITLSTDRNLQTVKTKNDIYHCRDEYVDMVEPNIKTDNFDTIKHTNSHKDIFVLASDIDKNNNPTGSCEHSPTPEFPPPTVSQAENIISKYIKSSKIHNENAQSYHTDDSFYDELKAFIWNEGNEYCKKSESISSSRLSEYIEEYVGDVPFAGLFKGSSLNLANDLDSSNKQQSIDNTICCPKMPLSIKNKTITPRCSVLSNSFDFDATKAWEEINNIFESINKTVAMNNKNISNEEIVYDIVDKNRLHIRKPSELLLGTSDQNNVNTNSKWCHPANVLIYNSAVYNVFYIGSTIIRQQHGLASTRKSIQRLKLDENLGTEISAQNSEDGLLKDINNSTRILKENNLQLRFDVGIEISKSGVKFIDLENKKFISVHDIKNINCVCQDPDDLRYFAYMTRENDVYYCHVFMVDDLDLAKEIIMTLGQAFEIAYQLTLMNFENTYCDESISSILIPGNENHLNYIDIIDKI